jgi:uncharacterized protein YceH (UPF0502 family)
MSKTKPKMEGDADARRPDDDMRRRVERLEEELKALRKRMDDEANKLETEW